ncbi:MAG: GreA/GreB family elongation factor [bacterium]|nr:GreA/GreB family elongation factor [bacterium]
MTENKFFLTKEGLKRIKKEYERLLGFRDVKAKGEMPSVWHSEEVNPEYLAYQEDMTLLESRIAEHENIIKNAELLPSRSKKQGSIIQLGSKVLVEVDGQKDEFMIVGTLEANPLEGKISDMSPVGRSLLGHRTGETVTVHSSVHVVYKILTVS